MCFFQLWDIRDGTCKQTFPGHESDINAVTVSTFIPNIQCCCGHLAINFFLLAVLSQRLCLRYRKRWRDGTLVRYSRRSRVGHVLTRQHHLRCHVGRILKIRTVTPCRLRWLQLQCMGQHTIGESRYLHKFNLWGLNIFLISWHVWCGPRVAGHQLV